MTALFFRRNVFVIAQIVAWLCSLLAAFVLIRSAGERIAPDTRLTIDANSYTKGARAMIASGDFFIAPDTYHSVGMQVLLSWVLRLSDSLLTFRYFNLVVLVAIAFGSHLLFSRVLESKSWAALASIWLAACASLPKFASLIQYEVVLCLALLCLSLALLQPAVGRMLAAAAGVILFFAVTIRPHFLAWLFMAALTKKTRLFAFRLLPALAVLTLSWNAAYSLNLEKPFFFWNLSRPFPIYKGLSERSLGMTYPPSPTTSHGGLRFIVERPGAYWKLLGRRFLYATSLRPDSWNVRSWPEQLLKHFRLNPGWLGKILAFSGTLLTAVGIFCFPKEWKVAIAGPIGCVVIVFFILNASFRYFIPMLPHIICAQAYGLKRLVEWRSGKPGRIFRY